MSEISIDSNYKLARIAGWIAVIAALLAAVGDVCILYAPDGGYLIGDYGFLKDISPVRTMWGHYLGVLFIPFEVGGIYLIYLGLKPLGKAISLTSLFMGMYAIFPGVAYHGGIYPMVTAVQTGPEMVEMYKPFNEPLGLAFALLFFVMMAGLAFIMLRGGSHFPKWLVLASPIVTYPVWFLFYFALPSVGNILAPAGFNLSMAIFFAAILLSKCLEENSRSKKAPSGMS